MPAIETFVAPKPPDHLPEWASPYAVTMQAADALELLDGVSQRLRVPREGGYTAVDIAPTLLAYLSSGIGSLKEFARRSAPHRAELAALAGRRKFPAASSISRYLKATSMEAVEPVVSWLLIENIPPDAMQCAQAAEQDRLGAAVHVFDWDPKVLTFRQRGLPESEDMPVGRRRSSQAQPGYSGRKRGNVQFSRSLIQHAASAHFVGLKTAAGNGNAEDFCQHAIQSVVATAARCGWATDSCVLRMDGLYGSAPILSACKEAGLGYLTRLSCYSLLKQAEIVEWMRTHPWAPVTDSGSGPAREALDLGRCKLTDITGQEVETRVVASRYASESQRGCGKQIGQMVYELYAVSGEESAWKANEVVEAYYARSGVENRYAQVDRELDIDRTFSYEAAGQHLATALALWIWNLQTLLGYRMEHGYSRLGTGERSLRGRDAEAKRPKAAALLVESIASGLGWRSRTPRLSLGPRP